MRDLSQRQPSPDSPVDIQTPSLTVLRTDTVFAKLPIHNLAKQQLLRIRITQSSEQGSQALFWHVSPSITYGPPQQLAYKLDTLLINRHLDALKRPLPTTIRLGSFRQICDDLGLRIGRSVAEIKKAFHQNAGAYITAKLTYRDTQGQERRLEAGFNRYGVVFTGESLPGGASADAVYIILNESYRQVLNSAPTRPVDYDYLIGLKPLSQRFYELLSFKVYAGLKYQQSKVSMRYSEFCLYAPQQRYCDGAKMSKQMHKVHQPHLASGYLAQVSTERIKDEAGVQDWILHYTPGPKARAEYRAFTGPHRKTTPSLPVTAGKDELAETLDDHLEAVPVARLQAAIRLEPTLKAPAGDGQDLCVAAETDEPAASICDDSGIDAHNVGSASSRADPETALVQQFHRQCHGLCHYTPHPKEIEHARRLIVQHGLAFATFFLAFASKRICQSGFKPDVFGGLMRYEAGALAAYQRQEAQEATQQAEAQAEQQRRRLDAYEMWLRHQLEVIKEKLPPAHLQTLRTQAKQRLGTAEKVPYYVLERRVAHEVETQLIQAHGLPPFEIWSKQHER